VAYLHQIALRLILSEALPFPKGNFSALGDIFPTFNLKIELHWGPVAADTSLLLVLVLGIHRHKFIYHAHRRPHERVSLLDSDIEGVIFWWNIIRQLRYWSFCLARWSKAFNTTWRDIHYLRKEVRRLKGFVLPNVMVILVNNSSVFLRRTDSLYDWLFIDQLASRILNFHLGLSSGMPLF